MASATGKVQTINHPEVMLSCGFDALKRKATKRGGGRLPVDLEEVYLIQPDYVDTILELDDALKRMEKEGHTREGKALELKYIGGLTSEEVAEVLGVSRSSVTRDLRFARAWLAREWRGDLHLLKTG